MKRSIALILSSVMLLSLFSLTACGGKSDDGEAAAGNNGDALELSYWIPKGEDSSYYMTYEENPGVKYLETLEFNGRKIDLSFLVPITGSELDNFNTLLMTDEYADIMDMAYSTTPATELYEDGYIYDLTPYMEEYMPNYMSVLESNPHLKSLVYANVDGEQKILSLYSITEEVLGNFMGFLYRRDWVAKYGTNPETGNAGFGGDSDNMRAYLQCLNTWWEKGWLDSAFVEHTSDVAYAVDSTKIHTGKVGMFVGRRAETGGQMDVGDPYTKDIYVAGARQPINDVYGSAAQQGVTPDTLYQYSQLRGSIVLTNKIAEEDLITVLTFLDHLYTAEGGAVLCFGLTDEQFEQTQDENYIKHGLTDGALRIEEQADGTSKYIRNESLIVDNDLASAMAAKRMTIGWYAPGFVPALNASYMLCAQDAMSEWDYYLNTGYPEKAYRALFTAEESTTYDKVHANVDTFMATQIPQFITGKLDVDSDGDWGDYCKMLSKYAPNKITDVYQRVFDLTK